MNEENSRIWTDYLKPQTAIGYRHLRFCNRCKTATTKYGKRLILTYIYIYIYIYTYPSRCNVTQSILSGNCSTCFGWYHHPSSGAQTTVSTVSGICQTVTATCRYCGRVGTAEHSSTIAAGSSNGVTNTRCCRYSCLRFGLWVEVPPETCRAVSR